MFLSVALVVFVGLCAAAIAATRGLADEKRRRKAPADAGAAPLEPPTPPRLPVIGHLHLLAGYDVPYKAFSALGARLGAVVRLQLGAVKCVVVNGQKNIREGLVTKGSHFDSRPNFDRYQQLFDGNKENSLAFCDWSDTQKARRDMLRSHTFPRAFTNSFVALENLISRETLRMLAQVTPGEDVELKPILAKNCANIFFAHFCSKRFDVDDARFGDLVQNFDEIFYEVNQGYAADFLPFLRPLLKRNMARMRGLTRDIRRFVEEEVVGERYELFDAEDEPADYVESLIKHVKGSPTGEFDWNTALFALEDIVGGHSAVSNFLMKVFGFLVNEPRVQRRIQEEIDENVGRDKHITIGDRKAMPYTEAAIYEAIRMIASPIVPRVANRDSSINGYKIEKGSVIFMNNYELNMSEELWERPKEFLPERFLKDGNVVKPEHFLPFGGGRRSCLGYRMVQLVSFGVVGGFLQNFTVAPAQGELYKVPVGSLALKKDTFKFKFVKR
ncbi:unnamed protein product [Phyllotreta striolata]|uniref:Cytochrome P450 monooxygenase n=1 Tax=Phyllotreta striolata TaxID=444603 RepID=A0A9N9XRW8_PHYSR|nr:unnamed protein product [Phyllotreta striolata]